MLAHDAILSPVALQKDLPSVNIHYLLALHLCDVLPFHNIHNAVTNTIRVGLAFDYNIHHS